MATPRRPLYSVSRYKDLAYAGTDNPKQRLDVYVPDGGRRQLPVVVCMHGGGWKRGDRRWTRSCFVRPSCSGYRQGLHSNMGFTFAEQGFVSVVISYRLSDVLLVSLLLTFALLGAAVMAVTKAAGGDDVSWGLAVGVGVAVGAVGLAARLTVCRDREVVKHPAHVQDAAAATAWVAAHIAQYGGDPSRIVLLGHSAGAHIASMLVVAPHFLADAGFGRLAPPAACAAPGGPVPARTPRIVGVVAMSGVYCGRQLTANCFVRWMYYVPAFGRRPIDGTEFPVQVLKRQGVPYDASSRAAAAGGGGGGGGAAGSGSGGGGSIASGGVGGSDGGDKPLLADDRHTPPPPGARGIPPMLLLNAQYDLGLQSHTAEFEELLQRRGVSVASQVFKGYNHGTILLAGLQPRCRKPFMRRIHASTAAPEGSGLRTDAELVYPSPGVTLRCVAFIDEVTGGVAPPPPAQR